MLGSLAIACIGMLAAAVLLFPDHPASAAPTSAPSPVASETPESCAHPNMPAETVRAMQPDIPPMAQQQGIQGVVKVLVSLDADSHITDTKIISSPSVILNRSALTAARGSVYQTEIRDCKPIPSQYVFAATYTKL